MLPFDLKIRCTVQPGDIDSIVRYHADYYAVRYGFNHEFGEYVRKPLTELVERNLPAERVWMIGEAGTVNACIALARVTPEEAQLRWYYVDESLRGMGVGGELMTRLLFFATKQGYRRVILWTVSLLEEARRMYERHGFTVDEEFSQTLWGLELTEQKYVKHLG